jgi:hypothetical protein
MVEADAHLARRFASDGLSFRARSTYSYFISLDTPLVDASLLSSLLQLDDPLLGPDAVEELIARGYLRRLENGGLMLLVRSEAPAPHQARGHVVDPGPGWA